MSALRQTNLLVGKNASGKTRIINALKNVAYFMQMKPVDAYKDDNFKVSLSFLKPEEKDWNMTYSFEISDGKVENEQMSVCGVQMLKRIGDSGVLKGETIHPPVGKLTVQVRRDRGAYPEIEELMQWAEGVIVVSCSNLNPFTSFSGVPDFINPLSLSDIVENLDSEDLKSVLCTANELGYDLQSVNVQSIGDIKIVAVKEKYVRKEIPSISLSSGMLRVLYLLCFLRYMKHRRDYRLLLVDDLGEGLDYNRATKLGKIVFDTCETEKIQLISSSNDSFLMDVVDISNWQMLRRHNTKIKSLNETNSRDMFDYFRLTGLSNFDFFSSDFVDNYLNRSVK